MRATDGFWLAARSFYLPVSERAHDHHELARLACSSRSTATQAAAVHGRLTPPIYCSSSAEVERERVVAALAFKSFFSRKAIPANSTRCQSPADPKAKSISQ